MGKEGGATHVQPSFPRNCFLFCQLVCRLPAMFWAAAGLVCTWLWLHLPGDPQKPCSQPQASGQTLRWSLYPHGGGGEEVTKRGKGQSILAAQRALLAVDIILSHSLPCHFFLLILT